MRSKRSTAISSAVLPPTNIRKRSELQPYLNESLPSLYPVRRRQQSRQDLRQVQQDIIQPNISTPLCENKTAIYKILVTKIYNQTDVSVRKQVL